MKYNYNFNYENLRNSIDLENYLTKNNIDISYINYNGNYLELFFKSEKNNQEIINIQNLLNSYPNTNNIYSGENLISVKNSSSSLLLKNQIYEGDYEDVSFFNCINIFCISDVPSLQDGIEIHFSIDGITSSYIKKYSLIYNKPLIESFPITTKFIKIIYKNNIYDQNIFNLNTIYLKNNSQFLNELQIKEENPNGPPTNGRFRIHGFEISCNPNTETIKDICWKYPISALNIKFTTVPENIGDIINVFIIPCINLGKLETPHNIGDNILNVSSFYINNINPGYFIMITDGTNTQDLGIVLSKNTETKQITVQNSLLTNFKDNANLTWKVPVGMLKRKLEPGEHTLLLEKETINKIHPGLCISICNGTTYYNLGEITQIDIGNNIIEIENTPIITFNEGSYIFVYTNNVKNMKINKNDKYEIGGSKIGGSYLNSFYVVRLIYTNTKTNISNFCWQTEYLY